MARLEDILIKEIDDKVLIYFEKLNQYLITEVEHSEKDDFLEIAKEELNIQFPDKSFNSFSPASQTPLKFESICYYNFHQKIIRIRYQTAELKLRIHPPFKHLEIEPDVHCIDEYKIFTKDDQYFLYNNQSCIFQCVEEDFHYLTGKISMEILNQAYQTSDKDWLAVFHAGAVAWNTNAVMFVGDPGSGKSTATALCLSAGMECISDDFVPLHKSGRLKLFPSGISIKQNSWEQKALQSFKLENELAFNSNSKLQKVKYLDPGKLNYSRNYTLKAVISIRFNPNVDLELKLLPKIAFLSKLIPDTWTSPIRENVEILIDLLNSAPSLELQYSNNEKFQTCIETIMNEVK